MLTDAEYTAVKNRALGRLFAIPGVSIVGIGGREREGRPTGERTIRVFVRGKRPPADLPETEIIPSAFEGVRTDVVDLAPGPLAAAPDGAPPGRPDTREWRELIAGSLLSPCVTAGRPGTVGCFLEGAGGAVYLLGHRQALGSALPAVPPGAAGESRYSTEPRSCLAAPAPPLPGEFAAFADAPGFPDPPASPGASSFSGFSGFSDTSAYGPLSADQAEVGLARLPAGVRWYPDILDIGPVTATHTITQEEADTHECEVRKRGAATRLTSGTVQAVEASQRKRGRFHHHLIVVRPTGAGRDGRPDRPFCADGDAGALVVDASNRAVGLLLAGFGASPEDPSAFLWGRVTPIRRVLDRLRAVQGQPLRVATANRARQLRIVPGRSGAPSGPLVPMGDGASRSAATPP
ncbi:hypothetical protein ACFVIM_10355 [Streptomyces sp. NPDC057638]|uniref:hypothetical protein n=1 Tax=Streptomyces sp. NPDC057638 TaxID=3346190 RepID=UPI0036B4C6A3